jgi:hypothetical protein
MLRASEEVGCTVILPLLKQSKKNPCLESTNHYLAASSDCHIPSLFQSSKAQDSNTTLSKQQSQSRLKWK